MKRYAAIACLFAAGAMFAETTPVMVSLVTPVQVPSSRYDVTGLRLSFIYGDCESFAGLDIGIVDHTSSDFTGVALGGVNAVGKRMYGAQIGLVNWNSNTDATWARRSAGAQIGLVNYSDMFFGLQDGLINFSRGKFMGWQTSFLNCAEDVNGLQSGGYLILGVNVVSGTLRGCQIGIVNYADAVDGGLQVGLLNIIAMNGWAPVLPIINGQF